MLPAGAGHVALELDERERLVRDLGNHEALILRNHGLLTAGASIAQAFNLMFGRRRLSPGGESLCCCRRRKARRSISTRAPPRPR
jgi:hypothetical protein